MLALQLAILGRTPAAPFIPTFKAVMLAIGMNAIIPGRLAELLKPTFLMNYWRLTHGSPGAAIFSLCSVPALLYKEWGQEIKQRRVQPVVCR